ncbi:septal ring lytic transglycosylase RlpA family protein [Azohydromonas aeria]|uniref:septal ring lytic transglycosylase RlpA family protein n=1 Tax=Azohydromonas aeria TaxID=2590212 RepID=UPI0012F98E3E|nr:septal ring lytic transglycosylase RlpA family protein [Azohydromonas aeria]
MQRSTSRLPVLLALLAACVAGPVLAEMPPADPMPAVVASLQPQAEASAEAPHDTAPAARPAAQPSLATRLLQRGRASWYAHRFHGRRTASGEPYDRHALTAAHPTLPIASYARVRNPANGREVVVRINDRGPFSRGHVIDVSHAAARLLGIVYGPREVEIEPIATGSRRNVAAAAQD